MRYYSILQIVKNKAQRSEVFEGNKCSELVVTLELLKPLYQCEMQS